MYMSFNCILNIYLLLYTLYTSLYRLLRFNRTHRVKGIVWVDRFVFGDFWTLESLIPIHPSWNNLNVEYLWLRYVHNIFVEHYKICLFACFYWSYNIFHMALPCWIDGHCFHGLIRSNALFAVQYTIIVPHFTSYCVVNAS